MPEAKKNDTWSIKDELVEMKGMMRELTDSIKGNGKVGLLTRMSNSELKITLMLWLGGTTFIAVLGLAGRLVYKALT